MLELGEQSVKVGAGELPFEGLGDLLVMILEVQQPGFYLGEIGEVVGSEHLALHETEK